MQFASADVVADTADRHWITLDIGPPQHGVDIPVRRTKMGPKGYLATPLDR
jgi:hypothetical protein